MIQRFLNILQAFIVARWLPYSLTVLLMAMGVSTILLLLTSEGALRSQFLRDAVGVDLVVGAKGSPLQLVLAGLYHVDAPAGNIKIADAEALCAHRDIRACVPIALGDNYQGFRIVGTDIGVRDWGLGIRQETADSLTDFPLAPLQALIGAEVARRTHLQVGNRFVGSHGLVGDGHQHDYLPYQVVGILPRTGTVQDRLILTPIESVQQIHAYEPEAANEITAMLVKVQSPRSVVTLPRWINANTPLLAAHPATEITRLFALLGGGLDGLRALSMALIASAVLSLFIVLYSSLSGRLPDLAILRVLGWSRPRLALLMLAEGLSITTAGILLGLLVSLIALPWFAGFIGLPLASVPVSALVSSSTLSIFAAVVTGAIVACILPVMQVYRLNAVSALMQR